MSELSSILQLFLYPTGLALIALLAGGYLFRRSNKSRSYLQWSIGTSLLVAAVCAGIALVWLYVEVQNTESFGILILLVGPSLSLAVIGLVATLSFCACLLWGAAQDRFVTRMGFLNGPGKGGIATSLGILAIAGTVGVYLVLPTIHLLPYSALSSDNRSSSKTLTAIHFSGEFVPVISLQANQWPEYDPSFRLKLDWRGRAVLDVWHEGSATEPETTVTHYLPFRESAYGLENGIPVAIE